MNESICMFMSTMADMVNYNHVMMLICCFLFGVFAILFQTVDIYGPKGCLNYRVKRLSLWGLWVSLIAIFLLFFVFAIPDIIQSNRLITKGLVWAFIKVAFFILCGSGITLYFTILRC